MTKILRKTEFGNPILRLSAKVLTTNDIVSSETQELIKDMYYTLNAKKYGVGLAAPQIGKSLAISVIDTKPTPTRPHLERQQLTIINPKITKVFGKKEPMWEGCISGSQLYAQVPRYTRIRLSWFDEQAKQHEKDFEGFLAHVIQHEVDHLNGIIFLDKVKDTQTFMTFREYKKMRKKTKP